MNGMDRLRVALDERRQAALLLQDCADGLVVAVGALRAVGACCGAAAEMADALATLQASRVALAAVGMRYQRADTEVERLMQMMKKPDFQPTGRDA